MHCTSVRFKYREMYGAIIALHKATYGNWNTVFPERNTVTARVHGNV